MARWICEIIKDFDGSYCANMQVEGRIVENLPENVNYNTLKDAIRKQTGVEILKCKDMIFNKLGRKYYALLDTTRQRMDCRVTLEEIINGYKPNFR